jgi:glucosamine kinase
MRRNRIGLRVIAITCALRRPAQFGQAPVPGRRAGFADNVEKMVQEVHYFLGIDGGGTGCRARLADAGGCVVAEGAAGPANLMLGLTRAIGAVLDATRQAFAAAGLPAGALGSTHACLGMAAGNVPHLRQGLENSALPFASVAVRSDAETACLGAHGGADGGGVLILGTGSQGVVYVNDAFHTVAGWGYALSDDGSGAILGRAAVRRAFLAYDGIEPASALTEAIMRHFDADLLRMLAWAADATPRDWGTFARHVFDHAAAGDPVALALVADSAHQTGRMLDRMRVLGARRICVMGGLAGPIRPYLASQAQADLVPPRGDALDGALWLARRTSGCHME